MSEKPFSKKKDMSEKEKPNDKKNPGQGKLKLHPAPSFGKLPQKRGQIVANIVADVFIKCNPSPPVGSSGNQS